MRPIIQLAHNLGIQPLAEGIETLAQRQFLVANDCLLGQGYHFASPSRPSRSPASTAGSPPAARPDPPVAIFDPGDYDRSVLAARVIANAI